MNLRNFGSQRVSTGSKSIGGTVGKPSDAQQMINAQQSMAMAKMSPLIHPSAKKSAASLRAKNSLAPIMPRGQRVIDDQSINNRLRLLQARFGRCIGLENGAWVRIHSDGFVDSSAPDTCIVLGAPEPEQA